MRGLEGGVRYWGRGWVVAETSDSRLTRHTAKTQRSPQITKAQTAWFDAYRITPQYSRVKKNWMDFKIAAFILGAERSTLVWTLEMKNKYRKKWILRNSMPGVPVEHIPLSGYDLPRGVSGFTEPSKLYLACLSGRSCCCCCAMGGVELDRKELVFATRTYVQQVDK